MLLLPNNINKCSSIKAKINVRNVTKLIVDKRAEHPEIYFAATLRTRRQLMDTSNTLRIIRLHNIIGYRDSRATTNRHIINTVQE